MRSTARRVREKKMCIRSGNKISIPQADNRVEGRIPLKANRCVGCALAVSYGKHDIDLVIEVVGSGMKNRQMGEDLPSRCTSVLAAHSK